MKIKYGYFLIICPIFLGVVSKGTAQLNQEKTKYAERKIDFNIPNGLYSNEMLLKDFGNGSGQYLQNNL
jgi:hypothetical protein